MQILLLVGSLLQLSFALMWHPKSEDPPYPDIGGLVNSKAALPRRRPALDSFPPSDVDLIVSPSWPDPAVHFGQVAAVTVDRNGHVVVFHRGSHVWGSSSFDYMDNYMNKEDGPVYEDTVVVLDPHSGVALKSWGKGIFYMPHGLSIDHEDNLWVTDVALHQVFKFPPLASLSANVSKPLMALGERFKNGKDESHFCKPSAVIVMENGDFFVSDGYCNSRIIKYSKDGSHLMSWGRSTFKGPFAVKPGPYQFATPHALTLAEDRGLVCVADRENGRVQCFNSLNGTYAYEIASEAFGPLVFSVAYTPTKGGLFYLVNGAFNGAFSGYEVKGFVVDANSLKILSTFQDGGSQLSKPHDVAVSPDGESVYVAQLDPHRVLKFTHKDTSKSDILSNSAVNGKSLPLLIANPSSTNVPPSFPPNSSDPSVVAAESAAPLSADLNLMANSSLAKAMSTPLVAISSLMAVVLCVVGGGVAWCVRSRRRAYPAIPNDGFNLGHLLASHSRRGFEQVSTEESDDDRAESDQPA